MSQVFGRVYADTYDLIYHDKDYSSECNLIEWIFRTYSNAIRSVLDLGCGTGNHAFLLARRGYEVVGVDCSTDMLAHAQRKLVNAGTDGRVVFQQGDIRVVDLKRHFDAVLMMFAVLSYQLDNAEVLAALRSARRHLCLGGILIFDVWYGPAVLHQRPSERVKVIPTTDGRILRTASGRIDIRRHVCLVQFHVRQFREDQLIVETEESHLMRYFFPQELNLFLEVAGFTPIRLGVFPEFDKDPDETAWNVLGVARAV